MGFKVDFVAKIRWCRAREQDRDMGPGDDSNLGKKLKLTDGQYTCLAVMDDKTKKFLVSRGMSDKGLQGQLWGTDEEGNITYKLKRPHLHHKFTDDDGNQQYFGPPKVMKDDGGKNVDWDWKEDGLIGNDSTCKFRVDVYAKDGKSIVVWEALKVLEHVKFESEEVPDLEEF